VARAWFKSQEFTRLPYAFTTPVEAVRVATLRLLRRLRDDSSRGASLPHIPRPDPSQASHGMHGFPDAFVRVVAAACWARDAIARRWDVHPLVVMPDPAIRSALLSRPPSGAALMRGLWTWVERHRELRDAAAERPISRRRAERHDRSPFGRTLDDWTPTWLVRLHAGEVAQLVREAASDTLAPEMREALSKVVDRDDHGLTPSEQAADAAARQERARQRSRQVSMKGPAYEDRRCAACAAGCAQWSKV